MPVPLPVQTVASVPPDIVVTAERLRKLRLATTIRDGRLTDCLIRVSSGDPLIDRAACRATHACVDQGITGSEPLANCVDSRVSAEMRSRASASSNDK